MRRLTTRGQHPFFHVFFTFGVCLIIIGVVLKQAREKAGLTQEELAQRLKTKKTAISPIRNQAEDVKLSTLEKVAHALGKRLEVNIA
jgi:transcriptional regulator with XRE-family HTH domain